MFPHESMPVYQRALDFAKWCEPLLERTPKQSAMHTQLDSGRVTVLVKTAVGAAQVAPDGRMFEAAQAAAIECAACLDLMFNKRVLSREELQRGKESLQQLMGVLASGAATEPQTQAA